ncbi:ethylene-responsive transcription factor CRF4-like [Cryptomeria japonica]|uniref:ethylene-responsive transcription factor CRF4-like n=1 Tax=Cryptomeria japonica TaxID=3369 RepID=UPI0027DA78B8|nr:ethylene-responsive transcription factor CRF4-like [Cryptomeria japonica]
MSACLSRDLLDAYQVIAMDHGIPLQNAPSFVRSALGRPGTSSRGCEHTDSQPIATAHPTAPPQHTAVGRDTPPPPVYTSVDRATDPITGFLGMFTTMLMEPDSEGDHVVVGSLHDSNILTSAGLDEPYMLQERESKNKVDKLPMQSSSEEFVKENQLNELLKLNSKKCKYCGKQNRYRGVRKRPWDRYVVEIRDPESKRHQWLGTFDASKEAANACDIVARSMKKVGANRNFD